MPAAGKFLALTFLVSMMPSVSALQLDCGPGAEAQEKTQHTLTCEGLQADGTVFWTKYDRNLGKITVATCDATGSCQTNFSTRYDVKRPNNVTSTLKILEVKRDETFVEGEWSCVSRSNETASCYVTVVFLPHVGECTMGFSEQSGQVTGRCEMHKVYPSPTCNWYEELEGQETDIPSNQTTLSLTQYVDSSTSQIYFRGECMLHRPLPVTAGSYSYKVLIIPGLVEPLVDFTTTNRVAVPAPPVLRNCPQDYVTDADANSCTCATSDLGSPQGSLAWYDPNNSTVLRNTSLILALPFSRVTAEFSEQTYRCGVVHHTGSPSVDYVPKIAASPNKPKLSGYDKNREYKVGETITLQCSADGGRPDITRVILQCDGRPDEADSHVGGSTISRLSFTLKESDNNGECECYATNGVFTSERVTQRINERVTSGKGFELEVWYVALPVAVVAAVVVVGILAYTIRKQKCCKSEQPDSKGLLSKGSQGGSTNTLNTPSLRDVEIEDRHSPNSPKQEATDGHYNVPSEGHMNDHVYEILTDGKRGPDSPESSKRESDIITQKVNGPSGADAFAAKVEQNKKRSSSTGSPARQHTPESPPEVPKHTQGMHDSGGDDENTRDAKFEKLHAGTKEEELDKPKNAMTDLTKNSIDKPVPTGDSGGLYTQDGKTPVIETWQSATEDTGQGLKKTPSLKQQEGRLSSGCSNSSSDKLMDNNLASESHSEERITDEDQVSINSEGEDESNAKAQTNSDSVGQQDQPHHKDGNTSPTEVEMSSTMKFKAPVPPAEKAFVAAPKSMYPTQPENDKEPASAPGREHLVKQTSGAEAETQTKQKKDKTLTDETKQPEIPAEHMQVTRNTREQELSELSTNENNSSSTNQADSADAEQPTTKQNNPESSISSNKDADNPEAQNRDKNVDLHASEAQNDTASETLSQEPKREQTTRAGPEALPGHHSVELPDEKLTDASLVSIAQHGDEMKN